MVVTAVTVAVTGIVANGTVALGAILIVCLVIALIAKEVLGHHKDHPQFALLHRALKLLWAPLALATVLVLGQQLIHAGIL